MNISWTLLARHRGRVAATTVALGLVALTGCGSDSDSAGTADSTVAVATSDTATTDTSGAPDVASDTTPGTPAGVDGVAFPVTIEHALGSATIDSEPERVVVLGDFNDLDSVLALGVTPVAFGFTDSWDTGLAPWQIDAGVEELEQIDASAEINVEEVAAADPDLIIGMEYLAAPVYDQLSELAPVVSLSFLDSWDEHLDVVASALGRSSEAANLSAEVDAALADGTADLADVAAMPIMVGSYFGDQLYIQGEQSSVTTLLRSLGLTVLTTSDEQMDAQSLENVDLLADADILLSFATDPAATTTAQESSLWKALPAVEAGRYTALTGTDARGTSDGFNALSYQFVIDRLVAVIHETAAGNGTPLS